MSDQKTIPSDNPLFVLFCNLTAMHTLTEHANNKLPNDEQYYAHKHTLLAIRNAIIHEIDAISKKVLQPEPQTTV